VVGGVQALVSILNRSDRTTERSVLGALEERDPELAAQLKKLMFVFEDLLSLDDRSVQMVLRNVDSRDLALALKGASEELREKIFRNMSQRAAEALQEDIQLMGRVRRQDVEEAQGRVVDVARRLEESGQIVISRGEDDMVI